MTDNNAEFIKEHFQKMLLTMGERLTSEFNVKAAQLENLAPGELKPVVQQGKKLFKQMLGQFFNGPQLQSLAGMFNKPFLESIKKLGANNQENSLIGMVIQILMQIGIPMLQNMLGHAKPQDKAQAKNTARPGYHPSHISPSSGSSLPHEQVNAINRPGYHRMTSGNRGH